MTAPATDSLGTNPARETAEREAAKREAHKPKSLKHKRWAAVHDSVKGWHVALIDDHVAIVGQAHSRATNALRYGNFDAFTEAAGDLLMARVRAALDQNQPMEKES